MEQHSVAIAAPVGDGRGGVQWEVTVDGQQFVVEAFVDEAFGAAAPLFELPRGGDLLLAAVAVDAAVSQWLAERARVDQLLAPKVEAETNEERRLIPNEQPILAEGTATLVTESSYVIEELGPPEVTEREAIRLPLSVEGRPLVGIISMHRVPGQAERMCHIGADGTDDSKLIGAVMGYMHDYNRANRAAIEAMLAESRRRRLAAGITDDELDPPQLPRPRVPTRATISRVFRVPRGRVAFSVLLDGREYLVDGDSGGNISGPPGDCLDVVVYFILDNPELMTTLGLNVEAWEIWR